MLRQRVAYEAFDPMAVRGDPDLVALAYGPPGVMGHPDISARTSPFLESLRRPFRIDYLTVVIYRSVRCFPYDPNVRSAIYRIQGLGVLLLLDREAVMDDLVLGRSERSGHD